MNSKLKRIQEELTALAQNFAVQEFLSLKNSEWLDEGEKPLSEEEFKKRVSVQSVEFEKNGITLWCNGGDLFFGHSLLFEFDKNFELTSSTLAG